MKCSTATIQDRELAGQVLEHVDLDRAALELGRPALLASITRRDLFGLLHGCEPMFVPLDRPLPRPRLLTRRRSR
jgi:hypothetical protein